MTTQIIAPSEVQNLKSRSTQTVREAIRDAMAEEMRRDEKVFLMGEEVANYQGAYKVSLGLLEEFGEKRVRDTPISEAGFCGIGVGAALAGLRPIVEFMTFNFAMQAIDHIINSAAKTHYMSGGALKCPIVFRGPNSVAARVAAQHSQCYASWYAHCPGLKVIAPYSAADAKALLKAAIRDDNPVVFLEHELLYGEEFRMENSDQHSGDHRGHHSSDHSGDHSSDHSSDLLPIGKAAIVKSGSDATLVAFSRMVGFCLQAAEELEKQGISVEVIDLRTLRPLDSETLVKSIKKTNRMLVVEEGWGFASIASEISAQMCEKAFDWLDAPVMRISAQDVPLPYAANLEASALPNLEQICSSVKNLCNKK